MPALTNTRVVGGTKAVATAGTRVVLATGLDCRSILVQAAAGNAGTIVVGDSGVIAAAGSRNGAALNPGDALQLTVNDPSLVWLDATSSGDKVSYLLEQG